jgi:phage terminase large subunit-like protein
MNNLTNALPILQQKQELLALLQEKQRRQKTRKIESFYPDTGPLRRELYVKHLEFFRRGAVDRERLLLAANRVGKTEGVGAYETTLHLTGAYPEWWEGRRFNHPVDAWAAGDTGKTTRDIIQFKLLGPVNEIGTGLIPKDKIVGRPLSKAGIPDAFEIVRVKHVSGGVSTLTLKSYDQRREAFQGTERDAIWLDEEPPLAIYTECLLRTMKTGAFDGGIILCTFTPLMGLSEVVLMFLPGGKLPTDERG